MKFVCDTDDKVVDVRLKSFGDAVEIFVENCLVGRFSRGELQLFPLGDEKLVVLKNCQVKTAVGSYPRGSSTYIRVKNL